MRRVGSKDKAKKRRPENVVFPFVEALKRTKRSKVSAPVKVIYGGPTPLPIQEPLHPLIFRRQDQERAKSMGTGGLSKDEKKAMRRLMQTESPARIARLRLPVIQRPVHRSQCRNVPRPCPFVSCASNNYLEVTRKGALKLKFPKLRPDQMDPYWSCTEDVVERGGADIGEVAYAINVDVEIARKTLNSGLAKLKEKLDNDELVSRWRAASTKVGTNEELDEDEGASETKRDETEGRRCPSC